MRIVVTRPRVGPGRMWQVVLWTALAAAGTAAVLLWKPTALVYGVQRAGLYAAVAIPMALVLGIVHIVNLAHGELMMVAAYLAYFAARLLGLDPFVALVPVALVMAVLGLALYQVILHLPQHQGPPRQRQSRSACAGAGRQSRRGAHRAPAGLQHAE